MPAQSLTIVGRRFVILPESEYKSLRRRAENATAKRNGRSRASRTAGSKPHRLTAQDRGDIAKSLRRLKEPGEVPIEVVKKRLGI